jgi:hypothetical protein
VLHVEHIFLDIYEQHEFALHNTNKDYLYVNIVFIFMKGLNHVLSIYIGLSFDEVAKGWVGIIGGKFLCVASGAKFLLCC